MTENYSPAILMIRNISWKYFWWFAKKVEGSLLSQRRYFSKQPNYSYSYSYSMAINTAHPGYGLSCCHGSLLQIRLNGYKREENVASQPVSEVVHTPLQHKQSPPQLQLLGATGWRPVPLSVASGFVSTVLKLSVCSE